MACGPVNRKRTPDARHARGPGCSSSGSVLPEQLPAATYRLARRHRDIVYLAGHVSAALGDGSGLIRGRLRWAYLEARAREAARICALHMLSTRVRRSAPSIRCRSGVRDGQRRARICGRRGRRAPGERAATAARTSSPRSSATMPASARVAVGMADCLCAAVETEMTVACTINPAFSPGAGVRHPGHDAGPVRVSGVPAGTPHRKANGRGRTHRTADLRRRVKQNGAGRADSAIRVALRACLVRHFVMLGWTRRGKNHSACRRGGDISPSRSGANWPACACGAAGASLVCRLARGGQPGPDRVAWPGGQPRLPAGGGRSAVWRLLGAFRDLARPDQAGLRIFPGT